MTQVVDPQTDDGYDDELDDPMTCHQCHGEGTIVVCWDDICQGQGYCMHGDGEDVCPHCLGSGEE